MGHSAVARNWLQLRVSSSSTISNVATSHCSHSDRSLSNSGRTSTVAMCCTGLLPSPCYSPRAASACYNTSTPCPSPCTAVPCCNTSPSLVLRDCCFVILACTAAASTLALHLLLPILSTVLGLVEPPPQPAHSLRCPCTRENGDGCFQPYLLAHLCHFPHPTASTRNLGMQSRVHLSSGTKQLNAVDHPHLVLTGRGTTPRRIFPKNILGEIWWQDPWNSCPALQAFDGT